jgi:hypothetical protein
MPYRHERRRLTPRGSPFTGCVGVSRALRLTSIPLVEPKPPGVSRGESERPTHLGLAYTPRGYTRSPNPARGAKTGRSDPGGAGGESERATHLNPARGVESCRSIPSDIPPRVALPTQ